ncbi:MAG TPA: ergothioneine biosynthesis protein EgtB [Stellaceae bacterium]|nr:ergothioneine biosynthesis protein EgtB [Stellaceae bacterium]
MRPILRKAAATAGERAAFLRRYRTIRERTEALAAPLSAEDQTVQSMADVSPTKWHRAHTSWFFETFLLQPHARRYRDFAPPYAFLFNSYYEAVGPRHPRPERGFLSRPGIAEIARYRAHVDEAMARLIGETDEASWPVIAERIELGLQHEQQHQELILMDIKHVLSLNPLEPVYQAAPSRRRSDATPLAWRDFEGGLRRIGHDDAGFAFDNEGPRHKVWLEPFRLANRLVTCGEFQAFIEDGGYRRADLWLSDGWATVQQRGWAAPLYWRHDAADEWSLFTLAGRCALDPAEPVSHVSFYEADAFARWCGKRLPSEAEWEVAAAEAGVSSSDAAASGACHPAPASGGDGLQQMMGAVWQWTASPYVGYPGYRAPLGAIGEYNGKFMANQMVLRGSAAITPEGHARVTYRNFFPPASRWAMSGIRLAEDAS